MTDQEAKIVPFGKYKGRLIDELLIDDPNYLQWLAGQDWFRTKFVTLHQVIINRGAEPQQTPDHNAMQVRFLDGKFCLAFAIHLEPDIVSRARDYLLQLRDWWLSRAARVMEDRQETIKRIDERSDSGYNPKSREQRLLKCRTTIETLSNFQTSVAAIIIEDDFEDFEIWREFEVDGVDVILHINVPPLEIDEKFHECCDRDFYESSIHAYSRPYFGERRYKIELKPAIGDDYPAVLRQMKANDSKVLFVGAYTGQGATREQFIKTFATAAIRVVFADQLEQANKPAK